MTSKHMTVASKEEAFIEAGRLLKGDYLYDSLRSKNAGYDIYFGTNFVEWISDLNTRLEVNINGGVDTVTIWIDDRHPLEKSGFVKNALGVWVERGV